MVSLPFFAGKAAAWEKKVQSIPSARRRRSGRSSHHRGRGFRLSRHSEPPPAPVRRHVQPRRIPDDLRPSAPADRMSVVGGKSVTVRLDRGGGRAIKTKTNSKK